MAGGGVGALADGDDGLIAAAGPVGFGKGGAGLAAEQIAPTVRDALVVVPGALGLVIVAGGGVFGQDDHIIAARRHPVKGIVAHAVHLGAVDVPALRLGLGEGEAAGVRFGAAVPGDEEDPGAGVGHVAPTLAVVEGDVAGDGAHLGLPLHGHCDFHPVAAVHLGHGDGGGSGAHGVDGEGGGIPAPAAGPGGGGHIGVGGAGGDAVVPGVGDFHLLGVHAQGDVDLCGGGLELHLFLRRHRHLAAVFDAVRRGGDDAISLLFGAYNPF